MPRARDYEMEAGRRMFWDLVLVHGMRFRVQGSRVQVLCRLTGASGVVGEWISMTIPV